jgi:hypothetical protein
MSWWVWALIAWGTLASGAALLLAVERSVYVERRESQPAGPAGALASGVLVPGALASGALASGE